jgi:hypothetical protein
MYFELTWKVTPPDPTLANTEKCDSTDVPWSMGVNYTGTVKQPIVCWLNPKRGRKLRDAFLIDIPLFSDRLITALRAAGVTNLQSFDAEVRTPEGEILSNYKAVNIVGAVMCADMNKSQYVRNPGSAFIEFTHLVLDKNKVRDSDLFRLGERPGRIMLSERIAKAIDAINPVGIALTPIESSG